MKRSATFRAASALAAVAFAFGASAPKLRADDLKATARALAQRSQKAVVTIRLVVKMKVMGQEEEQKVEVAGTVIDPCGLTVVSASEMDPGAALKALLGARMGGGRGRPEMQIDSDVKETTIILEDGTEVDADVVLKDADLDLAFIRPRDASSKLDAIELKPRGKAPELLEDLFVLSRLGRLENRAPALSTGTVKAIVKGPRTFYICAGEAATGTLGCVAFAADGAPLGVFVTKRNPDAGSSNAGMGMLMNMLTGGKSGQAASTPVLRSVEDVLEIAKKAKEAKLPERKPEATPDKGADGAEKKGGPEPDGEKEGAEKKGGEKKDGEQALAPEREKAIVAAWKALDQAEVEKHKMAALPVNARFARIDVSEKIHSTSFGHTTTLLVPAGVTGVPKDPNEADRFYVEYGKSTNAPGGVFGPFSIMKAADPAGPK